MPRIMMVNLGLIAGCLMVFMICAWAVGSLGLQLRSNIKSGKAVDQTLSEVDKGDAPGMFGLQTLGFVLLISASALIGIGALIVLAQQLIAGD